ncbi:putative multicopper oxidase [Schinkia azotoformans MEV2011]|uniref:Copper-containing nitrite reductase n=1 Tax=Schinkia azotoformans MEV2011 TaxID=1348973 RepID=A0A072NMH5_SCHAZ|nr:multicopper oxidase domain-containing protein [Schinkia azotoformans]KEF38889.1 putative multicopper oxidase [Schinkia azotoformans MEV2011]MEC1695694.1 multicopper oxidase domain-containing protein [Schinkia azotoformans]MEC1727357.1 multicopper oxidase domain-containing protein [Schinkia azotoformans]MEC1780677.1 multicopper oxidase domain-containing protein [Schinkia azotoformans]MED4329831.1 multicopper oxidase domain-containing protein [Schinkia azotoformans]
MLKGKKLALPVLVSASLFLAACGSNAVKQDVAPPPEQPKEVAAQTEVIAPHKDLNQAPVPLKMERVGEHEVNVEMTAQITDIEIDKGKSYKAWTFNGEAPGPLVVVNEGDTINFTLKNMDPSIPHSMDFHAVHASPSKSFIDVMPNESGTFTYKASNPGVFMYHCGTKPVLAHIANGMHGVIIVKPKNGYPTDNQIDKEFVIVQNEWYKYNDLDDMTNGVPSQVVFSTKALAEGQPNTNGDTYSLKEKPLLAKVGDRIRIYVNNVGPNEVSSFHVVGTVFDDVYIDGNPANRYKGMQTVMLPASGGAVVEFTVVEEGSYSIVTHQFNHVQKGAAAIIKVTKDGTDDGSATMSH